MVSDTALAPDSATGDTLSDPCADGKKSGDETGVDCGGSCSTKCAVGAGCDSGADCASTFCSASTHKRVATECEDGVKNGSKSDVDCGSSCLKPCSLGKGCLSGDDCASGFCNASTQTCVATECEDGVKNGSESDVDCGWDCPQQCALGRVCRLGGDCASDFCNLSTHVCVGSLCEDGVRDGNESDIDCGSCAQKCSNGKLCNESADCASTFCNPLTSRCMGPICAPATSAVRFAGQDGTVSVASAPALNYGPQFTIEAWIYLESLTDGTIFNKWQSGAEDRILGVAGGKLWGLFWHSHYHQAYSSVSLKAGQWQHVAMSVTADTLRIFIDGQLVGSDSADNVGPNFGSLPLHIGGIYRDGAQRPPVQGYVADVRISNNARYTGAFVPEVNLGADANAIALWKLDETTGTTADDAGSSSLDGTLSGAGAWTTAPRRCLCTDVSTCPASPTPCGAPTCINNVCGYSYLPTGTPCGSGATCQDNHACAMPPD